MENNQVLKKGEKYSLEKPLTTAISDSGVPPPYVIALEGKDYSETLDMDII